MGRHLASFMVLIKSRRTFFYLWLRLLLKDHQRQEKDAENDMAQKKRKQLQDDLSSMQGPPKVAAKATAQGIKRKAGRNA